MLYVSINTGRWGKAGLPPVRFTCDTFAVERVNGALVSIINGKRDTMFDYDAVIEIRTENHPVFYEMPAIPVPTEDTDWNDWEEWK